jgi:hypothetical protein
MSNTSQEISQHKLTQSGFTNFHGHVHPIDYCYLVDNIEKIIKIATLYGHDVNFSLDSVLEFVKFEFTLLDTSSVPEHVIDFVRKNSPLIKFLSSKYYKRIMAQPGVTSMKFDMWKKKITPKRKHQTKRGHKNPNKFNNM